MSLIYIENMSVSSGVFYVKNPVNPCHTGLCRDIQLFLRCKIREQGGTGENGRLFLTRTAGTGIFRPVPV
ncbi:MAG: hypothetical protein AB7S75_02925 [Desulfococcaceae bacterium]